MKTYLARILGVAIGAFAGVWGAAFGFLIGLLIDQYRQDAGGISRLERCATDPESALHGRSVNRYAVACMLLWYAGQDAIGHAPEAASDSSWRTLGDVLQQKRRSRASLGSGHTLAELVLRYRRLQAAPGSRRRVAAQLEDHLEAYGAVIRRWDRDRRRTFLAALSAWAWSGIQPDSGIGQKQPDNNKTAVMNAAAYDALVRIALAIGLHSDDLPAGFARAASGSLRPGIIIDQKDCEILGIELPVTAEALRSRYRMLVAQFHPDSAAALDEQQRVELSEAFVRIQEAYSRVKAGLSSPPPA